MDHGFTNDFTYRLHQHFEPRAAELVGALPSSGNGDRLEQLVSALNEEMNCTAARRMIDQYCDYQEVAAQLLADIDGEQPFIDQPGSRQSLALPVWSPEDQGWLLNRLDYVLRTCLNVKESEVADRLGVPAKGEEQKKEGMVRLAGSLLNWLKRCEKDNAKKKEDKRRGSGKTVQPVQLASVRYVEGARRLSAQAIWRKFTSMSKLHAQFQLMPDRVTRCRAECNDCDNDCYPQIDFDMLTRWLMELKLTYHALPLPPLWKRQCAGLVRSMSCISLLVRLAYHDEDSQRKLRDELRLCRSNSLSATSLHLVSWFDDRSAWCSLENCLALHIALTQCSEYVGQWIDSQRGPASKKTSAANELISVVSDKYVGQDGNSPMKLGADPIQTVKGLLGWHLCYCLTTAALKGCAS